MSCPMETWLPRHKRYFVHMYPEQGAGEIGHQQLAAAHPFTGALGQGALRR